MVPVIEGLQKMTRRHFRRSRLMWAKARAVVEYASGDIVPAYWCAVELNDRALEALRYAVHTDSFVTKYKAQQKQA